MTGKIIDVTNWPTFHPLSGVERYLPGRLSRRPFSGKGLIASKGGMVKYLLLFCFIIGCNAPTKTITIVQEGPIGIFDTTGFFDDTTNIYLPSYMLNKISSIEVFGRYTLTQIWAERVFYLKENENKIIVTAPESTYFKASVIYKR